MTHQPSRMRKTTPKLSKKVLFSIVLAISMLAIAVVVYFLMLRNKQIVEIDYSKVPEDVANLQEAAMPAQDGNLAETIHRFDELVEQTQDTQEKETLYTAKANVCAEYKDYECAIESNDRALEIDSTNINALINNGDYAYILGQKERGNRYYQSAIEVLQNDDSPEAQLTVTRLRNVMNQEALQEPEA